jgi:2-iminobutanoate/2-iminopropanoate deaminase
MHRWKYCTILLSTCVLMMLTGCACKKNSCERHKMSKSMKINPDWPWLEKYPMTQCVKTGNTLYISGQVAVDPEGNIVGGNDMAAQTRQVFGNMEAVLSEAGATLNDVVKITVFMKDLNLFSDFAHVRAEKFPSGLPASTAVEVKALLLPELLVEVEAIARIGSGGGS